MEMPSKPSGAVDVAKSSLHAALKIINNYEDEDADIGVAAKHIRDVLDQLCKYGPKRLKLRGKENTDIT